MVGAVHRKVQRTWTCLFTSAELTETAILANEDLFVEKASGCCRRQRNAAWMELFRSSHEQRGQTVCEVCVEKEANHLMHFPLMEKRSVRPKATQPQAAKKTSKGCFETDPTSVSSGKIFYLQITATFSYLHFYMTASQRR